MKIFAVALLATLLTGNASSAEMTVQNDSLTDFGSAIIEGGSGSAADKISALEKAGVKVARHPEEIPSLLK